MVTSVTRAWICPVCGYIHYGVEPPGECQVCGAERSLFETYTETPPAAAPAKRWRCAICGYIHEGAEPPDECPVCGADHSEFSAYEVLEAAPQGAGQAQSVLIIGAGIAGVAAAEALHQAAPQTEITLISGEANLPYYRLNLTRYLAGEIGAEQLPLHPADWYPAHNIRLLLDTRVQSVDLDQKTALLADGSQVGFNRLILALGAFPFKPPFSGAERKNVFTLRTRKDADDILAACRDGQRCVCIGGGLLGLEAAGALARRGAAVTVLENLPWLLPRQLNEPASRLFQEGIKSIGLTVRTRAATRELTGGEAVNGVLLEDGSLIPADVVVISAGVRSNVELARSSGLDVKQGVLVDDFMRTSHPDVYAAGDAVEHRGILYGTWGPAQGQGTAAGMNAAGLLAEFKSLPRSNVLKVLGYDLFSIGQIETSSAEDRVIAGQDGDKYRSFLFHGNQLAGAILLGDTRLSGAVKKVIEEKRDCAGWLQGEPTAAGIQQNLESLT